MGIRLSEITYKEAKALLNGETIIVLPISGGTKEHGYHLPLGTDMYVIDWIVDRLVERCNIVALPIVSYAYYPAFVDFIGSVSISSEVFMHHTRDIIVSFAKFGIKKFLIVDGGVSTHNPLKVLASDLHNAYGITVGVTDIIGLGSEAEAALLEQEKGGHADESETSCMLHIKPELVHMDEAVEEYRTGIKGAFYNGVKKVHVAGKMTTPHGIHGNATLATAEKGRQIMEAKVDDIVRFIDNFERTEV
ncbi:MAG: creatinine amidohydrolase [Clostridiales bacterium]|jgi:creatinine amidohydrolase|nr:creatinine amidohydrolase [Clostridiales bacterium]MDN5300316.1 creatinine amidohydrolase [Clostridiales bacterium]